MEIFHSFLSFYMVARITSGLSATTPIVQQLHPVCPCTSNVSNSVLNEMDALSSCNCVISPGIEGQRVELTRVITHLEERVQEARNRLPPRVSLLNFTLLERCMPFLHNLPTNNRLSEREQRVALYVHLHESIIQMEGFVKQLIREVLLHNSTCEDHYQSPIPFEFYRRIYDGLACLRCHFQRLVRHNGSYDTNNNGRPNFSEPKRRINWSNCGWCCRGCLQCTEREVVVVERLLFILNAAKEKLNVMLSQV